MNTQSKSGRGILLGIKKNTVNAVKFLVSAIKKICKWAGSKFSTKPVVKKVNPDRIAAAERIKKEKAARNVERKILAIKAEEKQRRIQKIERDRNIYLKKIATLIAILAIAFLAQHTSKYTSQHLYSIILTALDIPNYFLSILKPCNFNLLLTFYTFIKYSDEIGLYENSVVFIPQIFLIFQKMAFILPIFALILYRYVKSYLNGRPTFFTWNLLLLIGMSFHAIEEFSSPLSMSETDHYIMDRAQIDLYSSYGYHLDGKFDVIKVHEEVETPQIKEDKENIPQLQFQQGIQTSEEKKKEIPNTNKDGSIYSTVMGDDVTQTKIKEVQIEKTNQKKFRRELDSFLKDGDLIRLLHLPTSTYMASSEIKIDSKFYKVNFAGQTESSFHLWRIVLPKNVEYLQSGRFFSLKNAHTGLTFGIRSDGILNCSQEGRKSRQKMVIKNCENHMYYKTVQEKKENLERAKSKTTYLEKRVEYDFGFGPSLKNLIMFTFLFLFIILATIFCIRFNCKHIIDEKIIGITIFTWFLTFFKEESYFRAGFWLILLRLARNMLVK